MIRFKDWNRFLDRLKNKGFEETIPPGYFDNPEFRDQEYAWNLTRGNVLVMVYSRYAIVKRLR